MPTSASTACSSCSGVAVTGASFVFSFSCNSVDTVPPVPKLPFNHRPNPGIGEQLGEDGMGRSAIDNVGAANAGADRVHAAAHFGDHPFGNNAIGNQPLGLLGA